MFEFTWYITICFLLIFLVFSASIYFYTKESSFKYYTLYILFLLLYVLSKHDYIYYYIKDILETRLESQIAEDMLDVLNWYIQTVFYTFYGLFAILFVDLNSYAPKLFVISRKFFLWMIAFSTLMMLICLSFRWYNLYNDFYIFVFAPSTLLLFLYSVPIAIKYAGKHKYFLIIGAVLYIFFAYVALFFSKNYDVSVFEAPVVFFFFGIIIESIFFSLGIAYKMKMNNDETNKHKEMLIKQKHQHQVQTLESLMEGEEKERMRIAKELHDGVNVDLSAIKYKLTSLLEKNNIIINEAVTMIDKSCEQVRAISHNLIPPSLKDFSLIETLEDFCTTSNGLHTAEILFNHIGDPVSISKKAEVNIFRIVQELVNNSIKHAQATEITVQMSHRENSIQLTVEDNGVGFDKETITSNGIGLQNIQSRVDYLQAKLDFTSNEKGTSYIIDINTNELV